MIFRPELIVSGGQTGVDQAALRAATALGIPTGGYAPSEWWTEDGPRPELGSLYGLLEHTTRYDYEARTRMNVKLGDATAIFGRRSQGSNLTESFCQRFQKPHIWIWVQPPEPRLVWMHVSEASRFKLWLNRTRPSCLNIAGNRESKMPGIGGFVERLLLRLWDV